MPTESPRVSPSIRRGGAARACSVCRIFFFFFEKQKEKPRSGADGPIAFKKCTATRKRPKAFSPGPRSDSEIRSRTSHCVRELSADVGKVWGVGQVCWQPRSKSPSPARSRRSTEAQDTSRCRRRAAPARPRHPPAPWPPCASSSPPLPLTQRPSAHELLESCCSSGAAYLPWWSRHSASAPGFSVSAALQPAAPAAQQRASWRPAAHGSGQQQLPLSH